MSFSVLGISDHLKITTDEPSIGDSFKQNKTKQNKKINLITIEQWVTYKINSMSVTGNGTDGLRHCSVTIFFTLYFQLGFFSYVLQPIWNSPFKFQLRFQGSCYSEVKKSLFRSKAISSMSTVGSCWSRQHYTNSSLQHPQNWLHSGIWCKPGPAESKVPIHAN